MSEVLELNNELPLDTAAKRALIEAELRKDSNRSNREIGRVCDVDHKTVSSRRRALGIAEPLGNSPPTPTERRHMLIEGCKDFDRMHPPETAEEAVDNAIAKRVVSLAPGQCPPPPGVVDEPEENHFLPESESLVLPAQPAVAVYTNRYDQIVIRQEAHGSYDEDHFVFICPHHVDALIVRLRKFLP